MKILLAVDGSPFTRKMLDYVATHGALFDASHEYVVFNAQPPLPGRSAAAVGSDVTRGYHEEEAQKVLQPALAALQGHGLRVTTGWKTGPAGATIANLANTGGFDMLIMGSHGHGGLARLVMGSVTNDVLTHCKIPTLLIR